LGPSRDCRAHSRLLGSQLLGEIVFRFKLARRVISSKLTAFPTEIKECEPNHCRQ
jgi:hypothetical protein